MPEACHSYRLIKANLFFMKVNINILFRRTVVLLFFFFILGFFIDSSQEVSQDTSYPCSQQTTQGTSFEAVTSTSEGTSCCPRQSKVIDLTCSQGSTSSTPQDSVLLSGLEIYKEDVQTVQPKSMITDTIVLFLFK